MRHLKSYEKFYPLNEQNILKKIFGGKDKNKKEEKPLLPGYRLQNFASGMKSKKQGGTIYFEDWIIDTIAEPEKGITQPIQLYKVGRAYYYDVRLKKEIDLTKMTGPQLKEFNREARIDLIPVDDKGKEVKTRFKLTLSVEPSGKDDDVIEDENGNELYRKPGQIYLLVTDTLGKTKLTNQNIYPAFESFILEKEQKSLFDELYKELTVHDIFKDFILEKSKPKADYSMTDKPTDNVA
jgi:hypothetical protein